VFRSVRGLADWHASFQTAAAEQTTSGTKYYGMSDEDMLQCQLSLDPAVQKKDRVQVLQRKTRPTP
jgi:hypothetical protein